MEAKEVEKEIELTVSFIHNPFSCYYGKGHEKDFSVFPVVLITKYKEGSDYEKKLLDIEDFFAIGTNQEIFQIIVLAAEKEKSFNMLNLKMISEFSYGTVHKIINDLYSLGLIHIDKQPTKRGGKEKLVSIDKRVKIVPLSKNIILEVLDKEIKQSNDNKKDFEVWFDKQISKINNRARMDRTKKKRKH